MVLNAPNGEDLAVYYNRHPGYTGNCPQTSHTTWWRVTPYNWQETLYYIIRMLVLPLAAAVILFVIFQVGLGSFSNPVIQWFSNILFFIASVFFTSFTRELARARLYRITLADGLIDENEDPNGRINFVANAFTLTLNNIHPVQYRIGFVGDLMMMRKNNLVFDPDIINFFTGVEIIVGNLEGIVKLDGHGLFSQAHHPNILPKLQALLTCNAEWLMCLSNNHSIDFGNIHFHDSLTKIDRSPISYVFGRNDVPNAYYQNPQPRINITTATKWSNQHNWDCISEYEDSSVHPGIRAHHLNTHFNILYPHWGYENERYVRDSIQDDARAWLTGPNQSWDLIFGHHPHVRQPIMSVPTRSANDAPFHKLVVFSGGNFTSGVHFLRARKHLFGTIMTCDIGPLVADPSQYAIGDVRWQRTVNVRTTPGGEKTKTVTIDTGDYPSSDTNSLIIAIVIIASIILVRILELFFN